MKIQIKGEGHNITIPIPTALIFSKPSAWLWLKIARSGASVCREYIPEHVEEKTDAFFTNVSDEAVYALCAELMRIKRTRGSWNLVEVESASGDQVLIQL